MTDPISASAPIGESGKSLTFSTGLLAPQADGAVVVQVGETTVLVTAQASRGIREGIDFFPLTVDVEERMYAAGKIPGSFFRREGRPTEQAILACRLTDRPLRPSFPKGYRNETQVVATVLGADLQNPHDVPVINGASAALMISGIPFAGPVGAVRLAHHDGVWIPHPTYQEGDASTFELIVAGRRLPDGDVAVMMVEAGGTEAAWELYKAGAPLVTEEVIAEGLEEAKRWINDSISAQLELVDNWVADRGPIEPVPYEIQIDYTEEVYEAVKAAATGSLSEAMSIADKSDRNTRIDQISAEVVAALAGTADEPGKFEATPVKRAMRSLQKEIVRARIVNDGFRIDGRGPTDIRPLSAQVGLLKTAHGTGLFQRGETQVLSVATLGMPRMEQMLDTIGIDEHKRYMHHYNFPPFSTGETGRVGSPKRREIGHGALAERALLPVVPPVDEFPYTLRVVSDVLSSNGSTSMGSVCGSTLSLMDAGVPLKAPVAGIAMGLVYAEGKYTTLTDILGAEDAFGDMDFKVAGTAEFVTALQLDTKIDGLPADVLAQALRQAKEARLKILDVIHEAIPEPRPEVADSAPKIISFQIPLDRVGEVIGPKGKVINGIQQETGADINVDDDGQVGTVTIGGRDGGAVAEAKRMIELILNPPEADVGGIYTGKVVNITKFGAFVNILPGRDGLLHISKLGAGRRVDRVEDVLSLGTEVEVRVDDIDPQGKVSLSLVKPLDGSAGDGGGGGGESGGGNGGGGGGGGDRDVLSFDADWDQTARDSFGDLGPAEASPGGGGRSREGGDRDRDRGGRDRGRRPGGGGGRGGRGAPAHPPATIGGDGGPVRRTRLPNGLRVVTEAMPELRSVAVGFWAGTGSRDELDALAGASHFLEHLLFKGTEERSAQEIAEVVEAVGGEMNAFTTKEYTAYYVRILDESLDLALDILSDVVWAPAFRPDEVDCERQVILEEIRMHEDTPDELVHSLFSEALFPGQTVGREVLGDREAIVAMTRDEIARFHHHHYRAGNIVVAAAGNVDHDRMVDGIAARFTGGLGSRPPRPEAEIRPAGAVRVLHRPTEQAHLVLGMPALSRSDPDRFALSVLNHVIGGGMSSRLFQEVREKRGLAYSVYSYRSALEDTGTFAVYAGTAPERAPEVLSIIDAELDRLCAERCLAPEELERAKGHFKGQMALGLESSSARMERIGRSEVTSGEIQSVDEMVAAIDAVTPDDVARVIDRVLGAGPRVLAAVGPVDADDLAERLSVGSAFNG